MSNDVVKFDPSRFQAGLANMARGATAQVGFLKMDKTGMWSWGADENEVPPEAKLFVDPMGFIHGWQCWANTDLPGVMAELLGDIKVPMYEPLPPCPDKIPPNGRPWGELRGMSLLLGDQKLVYSTTSVGGLNAIASMAEGYARQFAKDPTRMIAVVSLTSDSYKHKNKTYGKIFVPVITVVDWVATLPGHLAAVPKAPDPEPTEPETPKPRKATRKRAAA